MAPLDGDSLIWFEAGRRRWRVCPLGTRNPTESTADRFLRSWMTAMRGKEEAGRSSSKPNCLAERKLEPFAASGCGPKTGRGRSEWRQRGADQNRQPERPEQATGLHLRRSHSQQFAAARSLIAAWRWEPGAQTCSGDDTARACIPDPTGTRKTPEPRPYSRQRWWAFGSGSRDARCFFLRGPHRRMRSSLPIH